ncbi:hypothetical protein [Sphaerisporangium dianthi]|uniref:Uncharacterized protein n=1 Tax=Sphaerisporangium dianthi TaxID=1436120 RepID=A0ABV9CJ16_9ACTN
MLEELVATAGTTIVAAMATSAWDTVRHQVAEFVRRFGAKEQADAAEALLDGNAAQIERAKDPEKARTRLRGGWEQILEDLLADRPDAADELRSLVTRAQAALPPAQRTWVQTITASGPGSVAAGAMGGDVIFHAPVTGPPPVQQ